MTGINLSQAARMAGQVLIGSLGVALVTGICFSAHLDYAIPGFLYLLLVVLQSIWSGFATSAIVSVVAAVCLEYFFIPPVLEWQVNDPQDGLALATYLCTSLVITRLASRARNEARVAERRRRDAGMLYEAAARLLALEPGTAAGPASLRIFREIFGLRAACFFDGSSGTLLLEGESAHGLPHKTRDVYTGGEDYCDPDSDISVRRLYTGLELTGAVGFEGSFDDESITLPLAALAATALERARSFTNASKAVSDARAETLRSAILDALAHEFKTPLAVILSATGCLRETSVSEAERMEMTEMIENQTLRLSRLTTRLLRTARLDREDVTPRMERLDLDVALSELVDQCRTQFGRPISLQLPREAVPVIADPELLGLAVIQLLDNACKYSQPESTVAVELARKNGIASIRVTNNGTLIPPEEDEQIFQRFFRGSETEHLAPGAGLGLYVARKIVRAHEGRLELDRDPAAAAATTFRIALPVRQDD